MKPAKWSVPQAREGGCHADLGLHLAGGFCGPAFSPARTRAHKASPASPTHRCPPKPRVNAELRPRAGLSELRPPRRRRAQQGETERGAPGPDLGDGRLFGVAGADAAHPTPSLPRLRWSSGGMAGGGQGLAFASTPGPWPLYPTPHTLQRPSQATASTSATRVWWRSGRRSCWRPVSGGGHGLQSDSAPRVEGGMVRGPHSCVSTVGVLAASIELHRLCD